MQAMWWRTGHPTQFFRIRQQPDLHRSHTIPGRPGPPGGRPGRCLVRPQRASTRITRRGPLRRTWQGHPHTPDLRSIPGLRQPQCRNAPRNRTRFGETLTAISGFLSSDLRTHRTRWGLPVRGAFERPVPPEDLQGPPGDLGDVEVPHSVWDIPTPRRGPVVPRCQ